MPTLDFRGKSFIHTHHLGVPYRELIVDAEKSCPPEGRPPDLDDNLILHGDNLEALKALLPRYAGKVDCIYIDPPYNTGTEGWCYNDAVNAPLMRKWLEKSANPVEKEDLQRHDKWLCMMWPRLQLLKELLAEDGAIFVSIDDNEVHRLRAVMDEVFGEENFIGMICWEKRYSPSNDTVDLSPVHEYVIVFGKRRQAAQDGKVRALFHRMERSEEQNNLYKNPDNDPRGDWASDNYLCNKTADERKNLYYAITHPKTGKEIWPSKTAVWRYGKERHEKNVTENRVWWGLEQENQTPRFKRFLTEVSGVVSSTLWLHGEVGHNDEAKKELVSIFSERNNPFQTPKPCRLIQRILELGTDKDSLILDSFAGSGTTAHAVLALNAKDGGNRKFILCEMEAYADTLTAERVRRVIRGYDYTGAQETELHPPEKLTWTTFAKDKRRDEILERIEGIKTLEGANYEKIETKIEDGVLTVVGKRTVKERMPGLGGSFTYVELGEPMSLERLLAETPGTLPGFASLARYLFHTATGHTLHTAADALAPGDAPALIGETAVWRIYLHYRPDEEWLRSPAAAFTRTQAEAIAAAGKNTGKQTLVFAATKFISHRSLRELRVDFAQLPYALHRLQAE